MGYTCPIFENATEADCKTSNIMHTVMFRATCIQTTPPSTPPPQTTTYYVVHEATAEGDVTDSDYDSTAQNQIVNRFAANLNVSTSSVTFTVEAASVLLKTEVQYTTAAGRSAAQTWITTNIGNAAAFQAWYEEVTGNNITVTNVVIRTYEVHIPGSSSSSDDNTGLIIGAAVGGTAGVLLIGGLAMVMMSGKSKEVQVTPTASSTTTSAAAASASSSSSS